MISRDMYRMLKEIPRWPDNKPFDEIANMDRYLRLHLLIAVKESGYVGSNGSEERGDEGFYLSEKEKKQ